LNDRQLGLLQRICDGMAPVSSRDSTLALTVYALRSRGLVIAAILHGDPEVLEVSETTRPQALELVEALAQEARRRGHKLAMSCKRRPRGLYVLIRDHQYAMTIKEHDQLGRLLLELPHYSAKEIPRWADEENSPIHNDLPTIFEALERRAATDDERQRELDERIAEWDRQASARPRSRCQPVP
jgi:hypothetical protein